MPVHAYNTLQLCKLDTQMLNPCEVQVSLSQNKYVAVLSSPVFTSPDILRIEKKNKKKKNILCSAHSLYGAICAGKMGWSDPRTIPPRSSEDSKGCKVITATGNRMPLLKTASHNTASESVASLTFFFPLSSFTHYQFYFSLNPQILQFSCKGSVSYKLFFFFFCMLSFLSILLRSASAFSPKYLLPSPWCHYMISEICAFPPFRQSELWFGTDEFKKKNESIAWNSSSSPLIKTSSAAATFTNASKPWCVMIPRCH